METWDTIRARRNVRTYEDRPIPDADLDQILEAGRRSPSANNRQHWDFVLSTDRAQLQELSTVWVGARHVAGSAATVVLVIPEADNEHDRLVDHYDLGQATIQIMLEAAELGIGSGHSAVGDHEAARRILGLPADHEAAYLIALGYPADRPLKPIVNPNRRPFDEVVHRGHW